MKKTKSCIFLLFFSCFMLTACGNTSEEESDIETTTNTTVPMFETSRIQTTFVATTITTETETTETAEETTEEATSASETETTPETTAETTIEIIPESTTEIIPETTAESSVTETEPTPTQPIQAGIWWAKSTGNDRYFYFAADGSSGIFHEQETGMGLGFTYEIAENIITFHIGDTVDNTPASVTFVDANTVLLAWTNGSTETLTYQAAGDFSTYHYYNNLELCEMAMHYYEMKNGYRPDDVNASIQDDGMILIEIKDVLGEYTVTNAQYTVDRFTAQGTDYFGNPVNLAE